ncbi:MAG: pilus assembly protein PilP [Desulfobacterales bacterium]|nr:pilus assembly protein PilP [Desulfobacterales bacterium]
MHKKIVIISYLIFCIFLAFFIIGCKDKKEPEKKTEVVRKEITQVAPVEKKDVLKEEDNKVAVVSQEKDYYDGTGKTDPFFPLFKGDEEGIGLKPEERQYPRTPLERVDVGQLTLVGIIRAESGNRAIVEEASGKGYIVKVGTLIGLNAGKVTGISDDKVVVKEEGEDILGRSIVRERELKLQKPPGE